MLTEKQISCSSLSHPGLLHYAAPEPLILLVLEDLEAHFLIVKVGLIALQSPLFPALWAFPLTKTSL